MDCPVCKEPMTEKHWRDDVGGASMEVESLYRCDGCRIEEHEAYGQTVLTCGDHEFRFSFADSMRTKEAAVKQFRKVCRKARRTFVRFHKAAARVS